jgi:hypothetical protein
LKAKLMEKTKELEKAEKSLTLCRDALNRGEKASLPTKLKGYEGNLEFCKFPTTKPLQNSGLLCIEFANLIPLTMVLSKYWSNFSMSFK